MSPRAGAPLAVVKVGGSLVGSPLLAGVLDALADAAGVVLVPGGGPFADVVRAAQAREGFDDAEAHRRALGAMEELGQMLTALHPRLRPAGDRAEIAAALAAGVVPVWMPTRMALGRPEIPATWDVTSDSLAAWLAGVLGARRLVLVKAALPAARGDAAALARAGVVDRALPGFLRGLAGDAWCVPAARTDALRALLASPHVPQPPDPRARAAQEADHPAARLGAHRIRSLLH